MTRYGTINLAPMPIGGAGRGVHTAPQYLLMGVVLPGVVVWLWCLIARHR